MDKYNLLLLLDYNREKHTRNSKLLGSFTTFSECYTAARRYYLSHISLGVEDLVCIHGAAFCKPIMFSRSNVPQDVNWYGSILRVDTQLSLPL